MPADARGAAARRDPAASASTWSGSRRSARLLSPDPPDRRLQPPNQTPAPVDLPGLDRSSTRSPQAQARPRHGHGQGRRRKDHDRRRHRRRASPSAAMPSTSARPIRPPMSLSSWMACMPGLTVDRIDPVAETERYVEKIMASRGRDLDEQGKALLREDLASPCTEEVAVFHAFSRIVAEARSGFVVLDTAPTGHTLLLMDATGAYHRQMTQPPRPERPWPDRHAADAPAGPRLHQGHPGDPAGDDAGLRGRGAAGGLAARRHRAVRLGHQQKPRRLRNPRSPAAIAARYRTSADSSRSERARKAGVFYRVAKQSPDRRRRASESDMKLKA